MIQASSCIVLGVRDGYAPHRVPRRAYVRICATPPHIWPGTLTPTAHGSRGSVPAVQNRSAEKPRGPAPPRGAGDGPALGMRRIVLRLRTLPADTTRMLSAAHPAILEL